MAKKKVADLLVEVLAEAGVRRIYGVSGDSLNGITDSIRSNNNIQWVHLAGAEAHYGHIDGLRRELRSRQPALNQRAVRLPPQSRTRPGHSRANTKC